VLRGGAWVNSLKFARTAYRFVIDPGFSDGVVGFRLVFAPGSS
jgi:hypothetical protein